MNIGIVCYPTYGGSGVIATELGKYFARQGHKVHFITYSQPVRLDILEDNIYYHEVNVHDYPLFEYPPYELALASKMVQTITKWKLDLLHVHYAIPHAYAALSAKQILAEKGIKIPIITTLHGTDITLVGKNASYHPAVNYSINHSDVVTSVSESLKRDSLEIFDIKKDIQVIPNFIDLSIYKMDSKCLRKQFAPEGQKILTHISNMRPVKRIKDVIEIFAKVRKEIPARLLMVGDGPEKEPSRVLARELGVLEDIIYVGRTTEIHRVLQCSDVFLLPSEKESFGLAALEAMAAGVPVISTNTGGLPEVNMDGETGFTSDVKDIKNMAKGALRILNDEVLSEKLKFNALAQAERHSIEKIAPIYLEMYQKAILLG